MPIHNADIAQIFTHIADYLDIKGDNPFRIRAYREAARTMVELPRSVSEMVAEKEDLSQLPGIGKDLAGKIEKIVATGSLPLLVELKEEMGPDLLDLLKIPGLGPRKINIIHRELGINTLEELKKAAKEQKLKELEGFATKSEAKIAEELERLAVNRKRLKLVVAEEIAESLLSYLREDEGVKKMEVAGSYRRRRETVGDLDILMTKKKKADIMEHFLSFEDIGKVISQGKTRSSVLLRSGVQVDLRVVPQVSYGAALLYFTGSKAHNIAVRKMGLKKDLKINEYGVFKGDKRVAGRTEEEVYDQVGLPRIVPELRENRGEIEAALDGKLPHLLTRKDILGDLHSHTKKTDGHAGLEEMAESAGKLGYDYLGITEHSKLVTAARGLDADQLREHLTEVERINDKLKGIRLLKGIEVDILEDGSLDLPDDVLEELDFTICSVHSRFGLSRERQTERIVRAMDNPFFRILGHPSGRLINERPPYDVDMEKIIRAAAERNCFLELNAHPDRLDLNDIYLKLAKELGVKVAISTDAHSVESLNYMRFGVWQARRGWLEPGDVLNTRRWRDLKKLFSR